MRGKLSKILNLFETTKEPRTKLHETKSFAFRRCFRCCSLHFQRQQLLFDWGESKREKHRIIEEADAIVLFQPPTPTKLLLTLVSSSYHLHHPSRAAKNTSYTPAFANLLFPPCWAPTTTIPPGRGRSSRSRSQ